MTHSQWLGTQRRDVEQLCFSKNKEKEKLSTQYCCFFFVCVHVPIIEEVVFAVVGLLRLIGHRPRN